MSVKVQTNEQEIELEAGGKDFTFTVTRESYNRYINSITPANKVAPSHNFLMDCVNEDSRASLRELLENTPGAEVQMGGAVIEEYTPDLALVVKKRKR